MSDTLNMEKMMKIFGEVDKLKLDEHDVLGGTVMVFGVPHHVRLVGVRTIDGMLELREGHSEVAKFLHDQINGLNEGAFEPVFVPGLGGLWLFVVYPFAY